MLVVGLILLAVAIAAAVVLIVQNRDVTIDVHALGHTQSVHPYWIVVAGLAIALVGSLGLAMMRSGAARARRLRRERAELLAENERLSRDLADPAESPFFADDSAADDVDPAGPNGRAPWRTSPGSGRTRA